MKPLSLALIRQRYASDGGAERFVARTLEALKGQDVRVTLITREWKPADGVEVVNINPFYLGRLWRDWSFSCAVRAYLKTRHFDIVQAHERIPGCNVYRAGDGVHREWLHQRARTLSWRGRLAQALSPYHHYVKWAERRLFTSPRLKAVICNSKMVRAEIKRHFGVADDKLHVVYNAVKLEKFNPALRQQRAEIRARHGIPNEAPLFLFVGSGFERKGVGALLAATARLAPNVYVLIVGRDRNAKYYQARAHKLGLAQRVIFTGSQADVTPYYGAADALVLPTLYDPFPNVVLEAMASGLPVITSRSCGAAEFVGTDGFVCDALDHAELAEAMRKVAVGDAANMKPRERVAGLTFTAMTASLQQLYSKLAPRR